VGILDTRTGDLDMGPGYAAEQQERAGRSARQVEAARVFEAAAVEVLRRCDLLERQAS
jgi:hypothetical protein